MKTSNKIFIAFLIFLFSGIIALYIGSKYYVEYYDTHNFIEQVKPLPPFSVVVAESDAQIHLINGSERKIVQSFFKTKQPRFSSFVVRNDTLFVFGVKRDRNKLPRAKFMANVFCENVKHFVAKENSLVFLSGYQVDSLFVKMNDAELVCQNNNSNYIKLIAKNSRINFDCEKLNAMVVELDKSQLELKSKNKINSISGTVKNDSDVKFSMDGKLNLDVDKSSYLQMVDLKN
ncbi:hypothetical protein C3L50_03535 [Flavobacterium alvei]|uniref:Uncharacterized protein n=1 Tax=Flavobacterium alvei TaxID=2080416 RepID=A0A2S5ADC2_9FLAO|nr:hypothetical protein [Flavobacterium alvei]POY40580.1 hypothetical protein C3L50_03535 [Flavobacterium alvei]